MKSNSFLISEIWGYLSMDHHNFINAKNTPKKLKFPKFKHNFPKIFICLNLTWNLSKTRDMFKFKQTMFKKKGMFMKASLNDFRNQNSRRNAWRKDVLLVSTADGGWYPQFVQGNYEGRLSARGEPICKMILKLPRKCHSPSLVKINASHYLFVLYFFSVYKTFTYT